MRRVPYQLSNAYHYRTAVLASLSVVLGVLYMVRKANLYRTQRTKYGPLKSISCDVRAICIYPVHASMIEQEVILSNADACSMTKGLSPTCVTYIESLKLQLSEPPAPIYTGEIPQREWWACRGVNNGTPCLCFSCLLTSFGT